MNHSFQSPTLTASIADADARASAWLGDANEARERGDPDLAERCTAKAQFWLDRFNLLTGRAGRSTPTLEPERGDVGT